MSNRPKSTVKTRIWRAIRIMRTGDVPMFALAAQASVRTTAEYLRWLHANGYVICTAQSQPRRGIPASYRIKLDTGPEAPRPISAPPVKLKNAAARCSTNPLIEMRVNALLKRCGSADLEQLRKAVKVLPATLSIFMANLVATGRACVISEGRWRLPDTQGLDQ